MVARERRAMVRNISCGPLGALARGVDGAEHGDHRPLEETEAKVGPQAAPWSSATAVLGQASP